MRRREIGAALAGLPLAAIRPARAQSPAQSLSGLFVLYISQLEPMPPRWSRPSAAAIPA